MLIAAPAASPPPLLVLKRPAPIHRFYGGRRICWESASSGCAGLGSDVSAPNWLSALCWTIQAARFASNRSAVPRSSGPTPPTPRWPPIPSATTKPAQAAVKIRGVAPWPPAAARGQRISWLHSTGVMSNAHVVAGADSVTIQASADKTYDAGVVSYDPNAGHLHPRRPEPAGRSASARRHRPTGTQGHRRRRDGLPWWWLFSLPPRPACARSSGSVRPSDRLRARP